MINLSVLPGFTATTPNKTWDNCDANGHHLNPKTDYMPHDTNRQPLNAGDIVVAGCNWFSDTMLQPAQIVQCDGRSPIRIRLLRSYYIAPHRLKTRIMHDNTLYMHNSNILFISADYRDMNPAYILNLLFPAGPQ